MRYSISPAMRSCHICLQERLAPPAPRPQRAAARASFWILEHVALRNDGWPLGRQSIFLIFLTTTTIVERKRRIRGETIKMEIHQLDPLHLVSRAYILLQTIIAWLFAPLPPCEWADRRAFSSASLTTCPDTRSATCRPQAAGARCRHWHGHHGRVDGGAPDRTRIRGNHL